MMDVVPIAADKPAAPFAIGGVAVGYPRYVPGNSGWLSGSFVPCDDTKILAIRDLLGQVSHVLVFLPSALMISPQPPSGCAISTVYGCLNEPFSFLVHRALATVAQFQEPITAKAHDAPRAPALPSFKEIVGDIQEAFGLHTTDLAEVLQVSRQSVHAWKSGRGTPNPESANKLVCLTQAAAEWREAIPEHLPAWRLHSTVEGRTLVAWLTLVAQGSVRINDVAEKISASVSVTSNGPTRPKKGKTRPPTDFEIFVDELAAKPTDE